MSLARLLELGSHGREIHAGKKPFFGRHSTCTFEKSGLLLAIDLGGAAHGLIICRGLERCGSSKKPACALRLKRAFDLIPATT